MTKTLNIKNIISALLLLGAVAVVATIISNSNQAGAQTACPAGLVSEWRANGDATDSADANHGTLSGNATFTSGKLGQAFLLDGSGDRIEVAAGTNLDIAPSVTVTAWVNPSQHKIAGIVDMGDPTAPQTENYGCLMTTGGQLAIQYINGGYQQLITDLIPLNTYTHVACVMDNGRVALYMDGAKKAEALGKPLIIIDAKNQLAIGRYVVGSTGDFNGRIDQVEIYNRALTDQEILDSYNGGLGRECGGTPPPSAVCGNNVVETGEQCDDGNTTSGDGCSATCQLEGGAALPLCTIDQVLDLNGDGQVNVLDALVITGNITGKNPVAGAGKGCEAVIVNL